MPRDGSNIYGLPFPAVVAGTTISSGVHNTTMSDIAQDLNTPRPIVAGGTAATSADVALFNLTAAKAAQLVTNYDAQLWIPGTFYSATTATGEPVDGHAFSGVAYIGEALANPPTNQNVTLEARDTTDGKLYIRRKIAGSWGSWTLDGDLSGVNASIALKVDKAGDTMTGMLVLPVTTPTLGTHATNKTYVDAADALKANANNAALTGNPTAPNPPGGDNDTSIATTAFVTTVAVRYDMSQSLTAPQQAQARANIGASPSSTTVTRQVFLSGSGTYNRPAGCTRIEIEMVGGGGGGSSSGSIGVAGSTGGATTFDTLTASAGAGGAPSAAGGGGGSGSGGYLNLSAGQGGNGSGLTNAVGGMGGSTPFGGNGAGGAAGGGLGVNARINTGSGGGGAGSAGTINSAGGGGGGGYVRASINSPSATYSYAVGVGGTGGAGGAPNGGNGGSGLIIVTEFYA